MDDRRAAATKEQVDKWAWQRKQYKKGEDPIDEWRKRRESGQISDLENQYGDPKKIGGIPCDNMRKGNLDEQDKEKRSPEPTTVVTTMEVTAASDNSEADQSPRRRPTPRGTQRPNVRPIDGNVPPATPMSQPARMHACEHACTHTRWQAPQLVRFNPPSTGNKLPSRRLWLTATAVLHVVAPVAAPVHVIAHVIAHEIAHVIAHVVAQVVAHVLAQVVMHVFGRIVAPLVALANCCN